MGKNDKAVCRIGVKVMPSAAPPTASPRPASKCQAGRSTAGVCQGERWYGVGGDLLWNSPYALWLDNAEVEE